MNILNLIAKISTWGTFAEHEIEQIENFIKGIKGTHPADVVNPPVKADGGTNDPDNDNDDDSGGERPGEPHPTTVK